MTTRLALERKSSTFGMVVASIAHLSAASAQELPIVPGIVLLQAAEPETCLWGDGDPMGAVLSNLAAPYGETRTIGMTFGNLTALPETVTTGDVLQPDSASDRAPNVDPTTTQPTVHFYPDNRVFEEIAACSNPADAISPVARAGSGRIWALEVEGEASDPEIPLPLELDDYTAALAPDQGEVFGTCLLMGGALPRQPATATVMARAVGGQLADSLSGIEVPHRHATRLVSGLFNPAGITSRGWDVALLTGTLADVDAASGVCVALLDRYVGTGDGAPQLGGDPTDVVETCPTEGLASGQSLRIVARFARNGTTLDAEDEEFLRALQEMRDCMRAVSDTDPELSLTIEGYSSVGGNEAYNWTLSRSRAEAIRDALTGSREGFRVAIGGFGETALFDSSRAKNRIAVATLTAGPVLRPELRAVDTAMVRHFLQPDLTCSQLTPALTGDLLPWMTSPFGQNFLEALNAPNFVLLFNNAPDSVGFAQALQTAATGSSSCGAGRGTVPHVGFLYRRVGPVFWQPAQSEPSPPDALVTDYFVLPPRITWIYPVDTPPDLDALQRVAETFGITSENLGDLTALDDLDNLSVRDRLGEVDVLTYSAPVPISDVLGGLARANAGTGWVKLRDGWE